MTEPRAVRRTHRCWRGGIKDPGGRPREYGTQAERQAAYRARKAQEGADLVEALAQLRKAIRRAHREGKVIPFDAGRIDTERESSTMVMGIAQHITRLTRDQKLS